MTLNRRRWTVAQLNKARAIAARSMPTADDARKLRLTELTQLAATLIKFPHMSDQHAFVLAEIAKLAPRSPPR